MVFVLLGSPLLLGSGAGEPGAVPGGVLDGDGVPDGAVSVDGAGVVPVDGDAVDDELDVSDDVLGDVVADGDVVDGVGAGVDDIDDDELVVVSVLGSGGVLLLQAPSAAIDAAAAAAASQEVGRTMDAPRWDGQGEGARHAARAASALLRTPCRRCPERAQAANARGSRG